MSLNGWQRLGIVVSVVWALGASLAIHRDAARLASESQKIAYDACAEREREKPQRHNYASICLEEGRKPFKLAFDNRWGDWPYVALLPIPFAWLLAYMFVGIWRWVKRGGF